MATQDTASAYPATQDASRRVIPLPGVVATALRDHRKRQEGECVGAGDGWVDSGIRIRHKLGEPMSPYSLTKYWHAVRMKAGLPTLRFHDLRQTAALAAARARGCHLTLSGRSLGTAISRSP